jgi:O-methyltransferase
VLTEPARDRGEEARSTGVAPVHNGAADLYLDLLAKCLTRFLWIEDWDLVDPGPRTIKGLLYAPVRGLLTRLGVKLVRRRVVEPAVRAEGKDWPYEAETMIGLRRLENLRQCFTRVVQQGVPGDCIECGVWRGGAAIFMRAILKAYGDTDRIVWVADSFSGLPRPNPDRYPADSGDCHWLQSRLAVPLEEVKTNFRRYDLLDDQVRFLPGWFADTLPVAPIEQLAVLRIDADM